MVHKSANGQNKTILSNLQKKEYVICLKMPVVGSGLPEYRSRGEVVQPEGTFATTKLTMDDRIIRTLIKPHRCVDEL
jgi:hypothetical protein